MRPIQILSLGIFATLLSIGCGSTSSSSAINLPKRQTADDKVKDAVDKTVEAAKAKRDEYVLQMNKALDELDKKYEDLKDRASKATGEAKKDLEKKADQAKVKRDAAAKKLEEVKEAALDRWEKIKDGVGNAFDELKKAFDK